MGYKITVSKAHEIIEIRFFNPTQHREHLRARAELIEICREKKISKILVDARAMEFEDKPSTIELFNFGVSWAELAQQNPVKLAGVLPKDSKAKKGIQFGDTVAYNRGFVAQAFDRIEAARKWLNSFE